jgi:hypothetical protein
MAKDTCVMCGKITPYDYETNIHLRNGYVEGMGQLCQHCYNGEKNEETLIITKKMVRDTPNDMDLGEKIRNIVNKL